ncbi:uncharacterized protein hng2 [Drosophila tropicalis]|uniref:uncharacterized protein hng2 n=1 Tax=Drosophila tropicalis TaxID=46794 RepID=UPI0035ABADB4
MGNHKVLKTAGNAARYSMYEFIDAIRSQKIIWDRRHPNFHNRELRDKSWQRIGQELCNNFHLASATERQEIVKTLLKRWKNTRDSYLRINRLRQSGGEVGRASYIYEKELSFLLDVKAETEEDEETLQKKTTALAKRKRAKSILLKASSKRRTQNTEALELIYHHQKEIKKADSLHSVIDEFSVSLTQDTEEVADVIVDPCSSSIIEFALESDTDVNTSSSDPTFSASTNPDPDQSFASIKPHMDMTQGTEEVADVLVDPCSSHIIEFALESDTDVNTSSSEPTFAASDNRDPDQAFFDSIKPHMQLMSNARKLDFQIEVLQLLRNFSPN